MWDTEDHTLFLGSESKIGHKCVTDASNREQNGWKQLSVKKKQCVGGAGSNDPGSPIWVIDTSISRLISIPVVWDLTTAAVIFCCNDHKLNCRNMLFMFHNNIPVMRLIFFRRGYSWSEHNWAAQHDPRDVCHSDDHFKERFNTAKFKLLLNIIWLRGCQEGKSKQNISVRLSAAFPHGILLFQPFRKIWH